MENKNRMHNALKKIALLALVLAMCQSIPAQTQEEMPILYQELHKYKSWNIVVAPLLFQKGTATHSTGTIHIKNQHAYSLRFGFNYIFAPQEKITFGVGVSFRIEPVWRFKVIIPNDEISSHPDYEPIPFWHRGYLGYSTEFPLFFEYNHLPQSALKKNKILHLRGGINLGFYPYSVGQYSQIHSLDSNLASSNQSKTIFVMEAQSSIQHLYLGAQLGGGISWLYKKFRLQMNLVYNHRFKPLHTGEYRFSNLLKTPDFRGDYSLSGNHLELSINLFFLDKKIEKARKKESFEEKGRKLFD